MSLRNLPAAFFLYCLTGLGAAAASLSADTLRCEYRANPLGLDETAPRLSWRVASRNRDERQAAYQVIVAGSEQELAENKGTFWDSGKTSGADTTKIIYCGQPLGSCDFCYWKVKVWDQDGKGSDWSQPAMWSMGLLHQDDWRGPWIGYDKMRQGENDSTNLFLPPPPCLRTEFTISRKIKRATLYMTALGLADFYINGRRATDDRFTPGWTDYTKRVHYRAYDVTALLHGGKNALGAILADGWYSGYIGWGHKRDHYGKKPRLRAQLQVDYTDGTHDIIASGPGWKASTGAILGTDFLMGETCDGRREDKWSEPGFDDRQWGAVATGAEMTPLIQAHPGPAVGAFAEIAPKSITEVHSNVFVLDMGQNFAGVARLKVKGRRGQPITLRFAERLARDGSIYTTNLRGALATDTYICRGHGVETWEPRFTYHGFQYIEVTGLDKAPDAKTITGIALSSETTDAGKFSCSDPMLNRLAQNIYWTQRANFIDIPTDCPQRDERLGWMGDAQVYIRAATLNEDVQAFFTKWLVDVQDGQRKDGEFPMVAPVKVAGDDGGPGWADAGVICPWTVYQVYGDTRILEKHYASMARFIDFCKNRSTPDLLPPAQFQCFGDWLNIKDETPTKVICTAYFGYCTELMAQIAEALGKTDDAAKYHDLFARIKAAFTHAYVHADGTIEGNTQTDYVLALAFDLLDGDQRQRAADHLIDNIKKRDWHLSTGFIGTKNLMMTLAKIGRDDVAYRLIHNDTFPSWGFSIKHGATSIWERWDGWTPEKGFQDPGMNSFAHYSFGAVYQWMVENIGGIRTDGPAYNHIVIAPQPDDQLTSADTAYVSIHGPIESHWSKKSGRFELKVSIPANTSATVILPADDVQSVRESDRPVRRAPGVTFIRADSGHVVYEVTSGSYDFETK
jgi:alpha-L-rhamnosidase